MAKATKATTPAAPQPVLQVKGNVALRGARAAWYATLVAHNGQPVSAWQASVTANPPSTPQKGKLAGKLEPPSGWLRWFVRQGIVTYTNP